MKGDRWTEVEHLLHAARRLAPAQRRGFIDDISDPDVRAEVSSLLAADSDESDIRAVIGEAAQAVLDVSRFGQTVAHFRVIRLLGRGGMGEVYLAEDVNLGRKVALKLLPPDFQTNGERVRRFESEARATAALNHPHIVTVYEVGEWQGQPFIAMEFVDGGTLGDRLSRGPMAETDALRTGSRIADTLAAAHNAGVIHRDLKPANLMLRSDGAVKVVDFGLARLLQNPATPTNRRTYQLPRRPEG